jgi:hypothetical protein
VGLKRGADRFWQKGVRRAGNQIGKRRGFLGKTGENWGKLGKNRGILGCFWGRFHLFKKLTCLILVT